MNQERILLGVAGGSGSGKTTVVKEITRKLGPRMVSVIHHDAYYRNLAHLSFEERVKVNFDHPDALETSLLVEHLTRLRAGEAVDVPVYDFSSHTRKEEVQRVEATGVIIVDGILVLASERSRSQHTNREEVTDRFIELVTGCLRPQKKRIPTKPSRASREKRLKSKKNRGEIKRLRGRPPDINH